MKSRTGIILIMVLLSACEGNPGDMKYKVKFTTFTDNTVHVKSAKSEELYSGIGTYITSLTPYHFSCKMSMLIFQDIYSQQDSRCHMISYVDGHDNQPGYEIASYADFSGNKEVEFNPILYSTDIYDGLFKQKEIDFRFLTFTPIYFEHKFEIPFQYLNLYSSGQLSGVFNGATIDYSSNKIIINTRKNFTYQAIHGNTDAMPTNFNLVFGNTDSSYIYMYKGVNLEEDKRFPFWDQSTVIIRSNKFQTLKVVMPDEGETFTMYSTVAFNTDNLIQVYAGRDNIPYTVDDVFVYSPRFWDRMKVNLETFKN